MVLNSFTPVLLIRGLSREQRHWGAFRPMLATAINNPVLSYDFAGCGELYQQRSPCNISALRQSIRQQWQQQPGIGKQVHLVALSLGGMLAIDWAAQFPAEVASVSLINSSAGGLSPFYRRLRWQNYPLIFRSLLGAAPQRERLILRLSSARAQVQQDLIPVWQLWQQQRPVSKANALRQLLAASRFRLPTTLGCPLLVLSSLGDTLVDASCSAALAGYFNAEHKQHPWAGHDLALDDPNWLCQQLAAFINC